LCFVELRDVIRRLKSKASDHLISESLYRRVNHASRPIPDK